MTVQWWRGRKCRVRAAIVVFCAVVLAMEIYLVLQPVDGLPWTPFTSDSFLVEGLSKGHRVSQTMLIETDGFDEILFRASRIGEPRSGEVVLALYETATGNRGEQFLYGDIVPVSLITSQPTFVFRFPEIDESADRWYRLDMWMSNTHSQDEIDVWATPGRWSGGGSLFINEQSGYADLVFETRASRRATVWDNLWLRFGRLRLTLFLTLAACVHLAFCMILHTLILTPHLPTRQTAERGLPV